MFHYIKNGWGKLAYSDSGGKGSPWVLLHGTGCDSNDWRKFIRFVPENARIVAVDFRGHGSSGVPEQNFTITDIAEDVSGLIDRLKIESAVIVGHSLGGMVAIRTAEINKKIRGLILLEGWTTIKSSYYFKKGHTYGNLSEKIIKGIRRKFDRTIRRFKPEVWKHFWKSVGEFNGYDFLKKARIPVLEIYGGVGRQKITMRGLRIPGNPFIETVWLRDCGHYIPWEEIGLSKPKRRTCENHS